MNIIRGIRFPNKYILILIIFIFAFNAITLLRFPTPTGDEAWMASRALAITKTGTSFGQLDRGILDNYEGYEYFNPWLSSAIQSLGIHLFGEPSLLAIRFISLVLGVCLLLAVYWIGIGLDGQQLGLLAVAFTAFSWGFLLSAHLGRPDIIAAAFGYTAIAIYLNNRSSNIWISILIGLIATLAFEVHPNGVIYSLTIAVLYLYRYKLSILRKTDFWGFIVGCTLGIVFFLSMHVFPNPSTYMKLSQIVFSFTHIPPILTKDFSIIWSGLQQMAILVVILYPQILLGLWAVLRFRRSRPSYINILLVINISILLSFIFLVPNKFHSHYAIHYLTGLCLLLACFINDLLLSNIKYKIEKTLRLAIVFTICIFPLMMMKFDSWQEYQRIQSEVNQVIKPSDVVMGYQLYWFGLRNQNYLSWENLVFFRRENPGSSLEEAFHSFKPDIFILYYGMKSFIVSENAINNYNYGFRLPESELESFLTRFAHSIESIQGSNGNLVEIYRLNWNDQEMIFQ